MSRVEIYHSDDRTDFRVSKGISKMIFLGFSLLTEPEDRLKIQELFLQNEVMNNRTTPSELKFSQSYADLVVRGLQHFSERSRQIPHLIGELQALRADVVIDNISEVANFASNNV